MYRITCIGSGGLAAILLAYSPASHGNYFAGGGAGGIAESNLKLKKGGDVAVTVDTAVSSFGAYLSATAGQPGIANVGTTGIIACAGGAGGSATGGNIGNYLGGDGKLGGAGGTTDTKSKYGGAPGTQVLASYSAADTPYRVAALATVAHPPYQYGAGRGTGKYLDAVNHDTTVNVESSANGAVIIEFIK